MQIKIRKAKPGDVEALRKISRDTFFETFSESNTKENMKKYLDDAFSTNKLANELSDLESSFYLAEYEERIIGYLKINFGGAQTEIKENKSVEIERIYVTKEFQGKKIGQLLLKKALDVAVEKAADYVWLGVWEENYRAISFYRKNGFEEFGRHSFMLGDDEQTDVLMKLKLPDV